MRIAFVINDIATEQPGYTTTHLALAASQIGHEVFYICVDSFSYGLDERVHAEAIFTSHNNHRFAHTYLQDLCGGDSSCEDIDVCALDVLMLRNDPTEDAIQRPWARLAGINFARFAAQEGVLVVNDPDGLCQAINKLYLQQFPAEVRPRTLICRDADQLKAFSKEMGGTVVLKPLYGSGGRNVFLLRPVDHPNMNQIIETIARDGYIIGQEYIEDAVHGDTRLFLLNGMPIECKGSFAAFHRVRSGGDMRSNLTAGANSIPALITDEMLELAEKIRPQLQKNGMFFVGLDIAGNQLMEINVFSPGGLPIAERFMDVNFSKTIIHDLERKLVLRKRTGPGLSNEELAVL